MRPHVAATRRGQMLTAAETARVLGVTSRDLADLVAAGLLRPRGPDGPGARRYPVTEVEALLNSPGGIPCTRSGDVPGPTSPSNGDPARPDPLSGPRVGGSGPVIVCPAEPLSPAANAQQDRASLVLESALRESGDPRHDYLSALGGALLANAGPGLGCELGQRGTHPHLLIRTADGAQLTVWLVWTSAGWRFSWNQWRSHTAADLPGAATVIAADLGIGHAVTGPSPSRASAFLGSAPISLARS
jgi:hypothetical protein